MLSDFIIRSTAAFGGTPFRLVKSTALGSARKSPDKEVKEITWCRAMQNSSRGGAQSPRG